MNRLANQAAREMHSEDWRLAMAHPSYVIARFVVPVALCVAAFACSDGAAPASAENQAGRGASATDGDLGELSTPTAENAAVRCTFYANELDQVVVDISIDNGEVVTVGGLTLEVRHTSASSEPATITLDAREKDRPVLSVLYQLRDGGLPGNDFLGGHGFTGLMFLRDSAGAAHQLFCESLE
jgi:hypothetical protein